MPRSSAPWPGGSPAAATTGSYVKARAEGVGLSCDVGIVERTERLILVLTGTGLYGLGVPYAVHVALWALLVGSAITVGQRFVAVHRAAGARQVAAREKSGECTPDPHAEPQPPAPAP
jgi:CDP-diacylglycerol--glycerol-3-phosphate 3-phosphatidyltransferase